MKSCKMEQELRCPKCKRLFINPVMLSCLHNMCLACASSLQIHTPPQINIDDGSPSSNISTSSAPETDFSDLDKLSVISEADSGVICSSRPGSFAGTPSVGNLSFHGFSNHAFGLTCPVCKKVSLLDEHGSNSLPKNRLLEAIVDKHRSSLKTGVHCQLCDGESSAATKMCLHCKIFYCDKCLDICHPSRGPFADHVIVSATEGKDVLVKERNSKAELCSEHDTEKLDKYCSMCRIQVCQICCSQGCHVNHDVRPLGDVCKSRKVCLKFGMIFWFTGNLNIVPLIF